MANERINDELCIPVARSEFSEESPRHPVASRGSTEGKEAAATLCGILCSGRRHRQRISSLFFFLVTSLINSSLITEMQPALHFSNFMGFFEKMC